MDMKVFLETERLILRQLTEEDADNLFELDSDPEVMRFINGGKPTDYEVIQKQTLPKFLGYYKTFENLGLWATVEKSSNDFIGWFHFYPAIENKFAVELQLVDNDEIALGYRLRKSTWGKGYATEGSQALIFKGFAELGVQRVVAWALAANKASICVMEKAGLKFEKEFVFTESQLPNLQPLERKALKYGVNKDDF
jgi:RimJ/RimL family protein N-acetyltransferase